MSAILPDVQTMRDLGINPAKINKNCAYASDIPYIDRVAEIRKILRKNDRQQFVHRYQWQNLPNDLTGDFLERVLYYRYSGIFFYIPELETFNFLPYVGSGLDEKGRYTQCIPLAFQGASEKEGVYIPDLQLKPIYDITKTDLYKEKDFNTQLERIVDPTVEGCVILNSYCKEYTNRAIPEKDLMDPLLTMMAEAAPLARTNLFANSGVTGMRVGTETEQSNVEMANKTLEAAALNGKRFIPVVGMTEFQEFANKGQADGDPYFMYMQALDNIRLQSYGLKNNGIFEKNEYINNTMAGNIQANVGQIYQDGLKLRQDFCNIVNANWGLGISCSASETVTNSDTNMDGETVDDEQGQQIAPDEVQE